MSFVTDSASSSLQRVLQGNAQRLKVLASSQESTASDKYLASYSVGSMWNWRTAADFLTSGVILKISLDRGSKTSASAYSAATASGLWQDQPLIILFSLTVGQDSAVLQWLPGNTAPRRRHTAHDSLKTGGDLIDTEHTTGLAPAD